MDNFSSFLKTFPLFKIKKIFDPQTCASILRPNPKSFFKSDYFVILSTFYRVFSAEFSRAKSFLRGVGLSIPWLSPSHLKLFSFNGFIPNTVRGIAYTALAPFAYQTGNYLSSRFFGKRKRAHSSVPYQSTTPRPSTFPHVIAPPRPSRKRRLSYPGPAEPADQSSSRSTRRRTEMPKRRTFPRASRLRKSGAPSSRSRSRRSRTRRVASKTRRSRVRKNATGVPSRFASAVEKAITPPNTYHGTYSFPINGGTTYNTCQYYCPSTSSLANSVCPYNLTDLKAIASHISATATSVRFEITSCIYKYRIVNSSNVAGWISLYPLTARHDIVPPLDPVTLLVQGFNDASLSTGQANPAITPFQSPTFVQYFHIGKVIRRKLEPGQQWLHSCKFNKPRRFHKEMLAQETAPIMARVTRPILFRCEGDIVEDTNQDVGISPPHFSVFMTYKYTWRWVNDYTTTVYVSTLPQAPTPTGTINTMLEETEQKVAVVV
nr:MAG: capsid protein [Cressdnaviricota sp.]